MSKRERIYFRVSKGALVPADNYAASVLRQRGYHLGDLVAADVVKPRNPKFNRLVHKLGQLVVANIEAFRGMDAHAAIKRLQVEGNIACEEIGISMPRAWDTFAAAIMRLPGMDAIAPALRVVRSMLPEKAVVTMFSPRSLSFESMDEGEYKQAARGISRTISERYWPDLDPERIENMADCMVEE